MGQFMFDLQFRNCALIKSVGPISKMWKLYQKDFSLGQKKDDV